MHYNFKGQKKRSGFTLVEVLVATGLLAVTIGMMLNIYVSGLKTWEVTSEEADLQARARLAMNAMVAELRNATRTSTQNPSPNATIPSSPNNKSIFFYLPQDRNNDGLITDANGDIEWDTNSQIHYQYVPGLRILRRNVQGSQTILASDVSDVQFIDIGIDPTLSMSEVRIILALSKITERQRNIQVNLSSIVRLRN